MKFPKDVESMLERRFRRNFRNWLDGSGEWPISINLSPPKEDEARIKAETVGDWVLSWKNWCGPGSLLWKEVRWRTLGTQSLPAKLHIDSPQDVSKWIGESESWDSATAFRNKFLSKWPELSQNLKVIDLADDDVQRLMSVMEWLEKNPNSELYPRQLPIPGLDTKWFERHMEWIAKSILVLRGEISEDTDTYQTLGLRRLPHLVRMRILDPKICEKIGGVSDFCASPEEIAKLNLPFKKTFIVENLQSGLAFGDISDSVLFMGLGNSVSSLSIISWIGDTDSFYWGDIDTYGFSILNKARSFIPNIKSVLMDEQTLCEHESLWGNEEGQYPSETLSNLNDAERTLYAGLKTHRWKLNLRLEQERISWPYAWAKLLL